MVDLKLENIAEDTTEVVFVFSLLFIGPSAGHLRNWLPAFVAWRRRAHVAQMFGAHSQRGSNKQ